LFAQVFRQPLTVHKGAVWVMKFNYDGQLLASGGNDTILYIWKVEDDDQSDLYFSPQPFRSYSGHTADILNICWTSSTSNLLLSASLDKTVRLWNPHKEECLCVFQHDDVVTTVAINPKNEELFVTGCLDNRLRVWNLVERRVVALGMMKAGFVTALSFSLTGEDIIAGSYDGCCLSFTNTLQYKFKKRIRIRGYAGKKGKKITGIEMMPHKQYQLVLVTSNDSRIRLYNLQDFKLLCIYKGHVNNNFQIYSSFSENGNFLICGSEDHNVYLWDVKANEIAHTIQQGSSNHAHTSSRFCDSFQAHQNVVTSAIFAPFNKRVTKFSEGQILVTADSLGEIKVFENKSLDSISKSASPPQSPILHPPTHPHPPLPSQPSSPSQSVHQLPQHP